MGSMGTTSAQSVKVVKSPTKHKVVAKNINPQSNPQKVLYIKTDNSAKINDPKY